MERTPNERFRQPDSSQLLLLQTGILNRAHVWPIRNMHFFLAAIGEGSIAPSAIRVSSQIWCLRASLISLCRILLARDT